MFRVYLDFRRIAHPNWQAKRAIMKTTDIQIVEKRGNWSKYSSPVFVVELIEREKNELDDWFGPIDEVERAKYYHYEN